MIKSSTLLCVCPYAMSICACSFQHAAQPSLGRADAAKGGDGDTQAGQRPTCQRAQPPKAKL